MTSGAPRQRPPDQALPRRSADDALTDGQTPTSAARTLLTEPSARPAPAIATDVYFSADVETDGPIPGPFSMLSFALVSAGRFEEGRFIPPSRYDSFTCELRPIATDYEAEAMAVNGLDRDRLLREGRDPAEAMTAAAEWIARQSAGATPVLVAYPVSFDWSWLYWYFTRFARGGSPFNHSRYFDIKTAYAVKARRPIGGSGRDQLPPALRGEQTHTHQALDDAIEQAQVFAKVFTWEGL